LPPLEVEVEVEVEVEDSENTGDTSEESSIPQEMGEDTSGEEISD
jgi:hypothetical protein